MGTIPVPEQTQQPTPSVASNVAPIAAAAQSLGPQPGVTEAQMGPAPKAQPTPQGGVKGAFTRVAQMAAIGIGPTIASIAKQHTQQEQTRNQHVIDTVWNAHVAETGARNKVEQYQKIISDIDQHMKEAQALPDSDPTKIGKIGYLAHIHQQVVGEFKQQAQIIKQSQQTTQALLAEPKNRKILAKAVGYDEKAANTPERQQMIAAIQKTQKGASQAEAQLESQFAQGPSQATPGLPVPVQQSVLKGAESQAGLEEKGQESQAKLAVATAKQASTDAYRAWQSDPKNPNVIAKMLNAKAHMISAEASAKKASGATGTGKLSGFGAYALYRMAAEGYTHNPELLKAIPAFAKALGVDLPPEISKVLQTVPHDQPLSATTGQPIGTSMPGAPTGATRSQAQTAQRVLTELPRLKSEVNAAASDLGPIQGRRTMAFLLGMVGSTGDPKKDEQLNELRSDLTFAGSASAKFHINSVRAMEQFDKLAQAGKNTAPAIQGFLDSVQSWATTAAKQERGYGETGAKEPGKKSSADPLGIL
jgi:hypothetical protein